ncbi:craniofacial development protein 2-like [Sipha flava]|uniref:Craniofacial development protein 2-like n=1 Tax=Sipha flava TaxID=143950 RepID=A0A8B8FK91_9HEMI|nr:craniofacial development protein 2-like [Sipha flava]
MPRKSIDNLDNRLGNLTGNAGILRFGTWNIRTLYKPGSLQCVLKASLSRLVKKFEPINDRICYIILTGKIFDSVIINCYALTETADCELKDQFYDDLDRVLDNIHKEYIKIVVEDFNTQVGRENIFIPIVGKKILHKESNNNGMRLISLCTDKGLVISSTQFQRKDIYKHTWIASDGQ